MKLRHAAPRERDGGSHFCYESGRFSFDLIIDEKGNIFLFFPRPRFSELTRRRSNRGFDRFAIHEPRVSDVVPEWDVTLKARNL